MMEERILDFLDGSLNAHEEEELLHRLAVSPERRDLLKQHLHMRELTSSLAKRQYVPVPKAVTASLFTTLAANGYAGPKMPPVSNSSPIIEQAAQTITKTPSVFRRSIVAASAISFIAGAALIYFLMPQAQRENLTASSAHISPANIAAISNEPLRQNTISENRSYRTHRTYRLDKTDFPIVNNTDNNKSTIVETPSAPIGLISMVEPRFEQVQPLPLHVHGEGSISRNPLDTHSKNSIDEKSFLQRLSFSFSSSEGKAPGNQQALTGSIQEAKISFDITDWLFARVSLGRFLPFETEAVAATPGFNADGIPLIEFSPIQKIRTAAGAELGLKWQMFSAPFQFSGGFLSDFQGNFIPRSSFFTTLMLNDNVDMNVGLEAMLYNHSIGENAFAGSHALLVGQMQSKELTGFIGPAIELVWHF